MIGPSDKAGPNFQEKSGSIWEAYGFFFYSSDGG